MIKIDIDKFYLTFFNKTQAHRISLILMTHQGIIDNWNEFWTNKKVKVHFKFFESNE